ncbi:MAG: 50S ribosomal protein L6 [Actinobacteria bacterium]|nr:50S ribosomal protein L6 [Actinomycetota bacterium]MCL5446590.1 50S ribosomal protein L6 [Actinomycetota bacterium]
MSRIGKQPVQLPSGVTITAGEGRIEVKGPKGALSRDLPPEITLVQEDSTIVVHRQNDEHRVKALHGLYRTLIFNMVTGVTAGYTKQLEIVGVGYRAVSKGPSQIEMALGYSHPVLVRAPDGITLEVPVPTRVIVSGIDKEQVGQIAADIRKIRKPEPYKGKGVMYAGERIIRKAGKAAK